jgi:hypothetical protein
MLVLVCTTLPLPMSWISLTDRGSLIRIYRLGDGEAYYSIRPRRALESANRLEIAYFIPYMWHPRYCFHYNSL